MNPMKEIKWMFVFLLIMINIVNASETIELKKIALKQVLKKHKIRPVYYIMSIIMRYVYVIPTLRELCPHKYWLGFVLSSFDQRTIYSSDRKNIYITNSMTGERLHTIDTNGIFFGKADIASDNSFLVIYGCYHSNIYLWDIKKGSSKKIPTPCEPRDVTIFNKNTQLAILDYKNYLRIWDLPSNQEIMCLSLNNFIFDLDNQRAFCVSPDSKWIVYWSDDYKVGIWDIQKNKRTCVLMKTWYFKGIDISKDGRYIAVFIDDRTIKVYKWSISTWKLYTEWEKLEKNIFSYTFFTCDYLISIYADSYEVWSPYTAEHRRGKLSNYVRSVILWDGFLLLSGSMGNISVDPQYGSIKVEDLEKFVPEVAEKKSILTIVGSHFKKIITL